MAKVTYDYKNTNLPVPAVEFVDNIHEHMKKVTGKKIRKADIWFAALSSFNEKTENEQLEILNSLGINC